MNFTLFVYDSCTRFRKKIKKFCENVLTLSAIVGTI
nr:MAG TPA: hypothetical protein [Caudoviricetes sp.]